MNNREKPQSKRKLINKIRKKTNKRMKNLAQSYKNTTSQSGSAIRKLMNDNQPDMEFDMVNHITMGHSRKLKKKMKKLKKKISGQNAEEKIFNQMQKYKSNIVKMQEKTIFNPVNQMAKRRQKRMKRMEQNTRNMKKQVIHKNNAK